MIRWSDYGFALVGAELHDDFHGGVRRVWTAPTPLSHPLLWFPVADISQLAER